jgi:paraquat-inducible protein B
MGGQPFITLDLVPGAAPATLERGGAYPLIPTLPPQPDPLRAALDGLILRVDALPLEDLAKNAQGTLLAAHSLLIGPQAKQALDNLVETTGELRNAAGRLDQLLPPLAQSAQDTLVDVRGLVTGPDVRRAMGNLVATTDQLKAVAGRLGERADPLISSLTRTTDAAREAVLQASRTLSRLDGTVGAQAPIWTQVQALLRELTGASRAARLLTDYLERHPDALIRGKSEQSP